MESKIRQRLNEKGIVENPDTICKFPRNILIEPTNICNNSCLFCANSKSTKKKGIIKPELVQKILREAYELGVGEVGFYGTGEPLLDKNLENHIAYAKKLGYEYIYITTNGALLTKERADAIVEAGIDSIKFSINAANRRDYLFVHGKDEFDKVIDNLMYLHTLKKKTKKKFLLYISYIITRYAEKGKDEFKQMYERYVDDIVFKYCNNADGTMTREVEKCLPLNHNSKYTSANNICPIIFKNLYVTYEGYLTMCCADYQNYLVIADLNKENLADAWNNQYAQQLRRYHLEHKLEGTLCYNCINNCISEVRPLREEYAAVVDMENWDKSSEIEERIHRYEHGNDW